MRNIKGIVLLAILATVGCQKTDLPPDDTGSEPVFSATLVFENGESFEVAAGELNYYLFTDFRQDSLDVLEYYGRLAQTDCAEFCGPSLEIIFRDEKQAQSTPLEDIVLSGKDFEYALPGQVQQDTLTQYGMSLNSISQTGGLSIPNIWTIDDSLSYVTLDPTFLFPTAFPLEVKLTLDGQTFGCFSEQTRIISWTGGTDCGVYIEAPDSLINQLSAVPQGGQPPFLYQWSTGDSSQSILINQAGNYCVTLTDDAGCVSTSCVQTPQGPAQTFCSAAFEYATFEQDSIVQVPPDFLQLGKVIVVFTDENGVEYRSDRFAQAPGALFEIQEAGFYEMNENGDPTRTFAAVFQGTLWSSSGESLIIMDGYANLAVAYPE